MLLESLPQLTFFTISGEESTGEFCTVNLHISAQLGHISISFQPIGFSMCLEGKEKQIWVIEVSFTESKQKER